MADAAAVDAVVRDVASAPRGDVLFPYDETTLRIPEVLTDLGALRERSEKEYALRATDDVESKLRAMDVIRTFIKANRRKIYGGVALDALVRSADPSDGVYAEADGVPDVEFYSSTPIHDTVDICLALHAAGFTRVSGLEARHHETYTVSVDGWRCCDITYMQRWIYQHTRTVAIDGFLYVHPHFMLIDYLRMITDPLVSYWRIEKFFPRLLKLQKHFPISRPAATERVVRAWTARKTEAPEAHALLARLCAALDRESVVLIGHFATDRFLEATGRSALRVPLLEFLSTRFARDVEFAYAFLAERLAPEDRAALAYEEYYPFFDFWGARGVITLRGRPIARVFQVDHKCVPFVTFPADANDAAQGRATATVTAGRRTRRGGGAQEESSDAAAPLRVGSFSVVVMNYCIGRLRAEVEGNEEEVQAHDVLVYLMYALRQDHAARNPDFDMRDDASPFAEFVFSCLGAPSQPDIVKREIAHYKKTHFKQRPFRFDTEEMIKRRDFDKLAFADGFRFMNTSGNLKRNAQEVLARIDGAADGPSSPSPSAEPSAEPSSSSREPTAGGGGQPQTPKSSRRRRGRARTAKEPQTPPPQTSRTTPTRGRRAATASAPPKPAVALRSPRPR